MKTILERQLIARLKNKTAWISGGKRVGQVIAAALAEQGVNIIASYRGSKAEAEKIAARSVRLGVRSMAVQMDASSKISVERAARQVLKKFPQIHILVNMASVFEPLEFSRISEKDWQDNVGAHIYGTFWPTQILSPHMPRGSHVVNISDRTSLGRIYKRYVPYVVTKHAVDALTRATAKELADKGIVVNAIAPGPILPPDFTSQKEWQALRSHSSLKLPITDKEAVEQFALLVLYLSSVTMTSGCTYSLDQGQNL